MNNREWVDRYLSMGWRIVPIKPKSKQFKVNKSWSELRACDFGVDDFDVDDNIGLDPSSAGLVDIDLDCLEAVAVARLFLPESKLIFGRPRKPRSHYLYRCLAGFEEDTKLVIKGETILEIRTGNAGHTRIPPGIHVNGDQSEEALEWSIFEEPTEVAPDLLKRRCSLLAVTTLISRAFPAPGARHDWCLALWGALRQLGVTREEGGEILKALLLLIEETKAPDREQELKSTYDLPDTAVMAGLSVLNRFDKELGKNLTRFLGSTVTVRGFFGSPRGGIDAGNPKNYMIAVEREGIRLAYDIFSRQKVIRQGGRERPLDDDIVKELRFSCHDKHGFLPQKELFHDTLERHAWLNPFNPVLDYLDSLPAWDGKDRIDTWLIDYLGAKDTPFNRAVGRLTLIAAVKRINQPGCKFDQLLVLEGRQGSGKSSSIAALCPDKEWFTDNLPMAASPQHVIEATKGKWLCEISELFGLSKKDIENTKAFLSRQVDEARKVYAREPEQRPRMFICIGTTNKKEYLADPTGNRRFWPVKVNDRQDIDALERDRDLIWAEANLYRDETVTLDENLWGEAVAEQSRREQEDPWEAYIDGLMQAPPAHIKSPSQIRISYDDAYDTIGIPVASRDRITHARLSEVMDRLGFRKTAFKRDKKAHKGWVKDLSEQELKELTEEDDTPF